MEENFYFYILLMNIHMEHVFLYIVSMASLASFRPCFLYLSIFECYSTSIMLVMPVKNERIVGKSSGIDKQRIYAYLYK